MDIRNGSTRNNLYAFRISDAYERSSSRSSSVHQQQQQRPPPPAAQQEWRSSNYHLQHHQPQQNHSSSSVHGHHLEHPSLQQQSYPYRHRPKPSAEMSTVSVASEVNSHGASSPSNTGASSTTTQHQQHHHHHQQQQIDTVVALYDFVPTDRPHALAMNKGDTIAVFSKLPSGWWEGANHNGHRGWFPSNYTQQISSTSTLTATPQPTVSSHMLSKAEINPHLSREQLRMGGLAQPFRFNAANTSSDSVDPLTSTSTFNFSSPNINDFAIAVQVADEEVDPQAAEREHAVVVGGESSVSYDGSRKGSIASYSSSVPDDRSQITHLETYKLVNTRSNQYTHTPSHWVPHVANGQVCYANTTRKHVSTDLPFEVVESTNDAEVIPKTIPAPQDFLDHAFNDNRIPVLDETIDLQARRERSSRSSFESKTSSSVTVNPSDFHSWSALMSHLRTCIQNLNDTFANWNESGLAKRYNEVAQAIQTLNLVAGIPPGSLPSAATSPEIAVLFRRIMNDLSKLGLICDICATRRSAQSRRPSATSSVESIEQNNFLSNEEFETMCVSLLEDSEKFVQAYKELLKSELGELGEENGGTDDFDRIEAPPAAYNVKHFKDGIWVNASVNTNGRTSSLGDTASVHSGNAGLGISASATNMRRSIFQLESYESNVSVDEESVGAMEDKQGVVNTSIEHINNALSEQCEKTVDAVQERRRNIKSYLQNLSNALRIVLNLVESLDLTIFYGSKRRSMIHKSVKNSNVRDAFACLQLLYQFLDAKQALYNALLSLSDITGQSLTANNGLIETLSKQLGQAQLADVLLSAENANESQIRDIVQNVSQNYGILAQVASILAEERISLLTMNNQRQIDMQTQSSGSQRPSVSGSFEGVRSDSASDLRVTPTTSRHISSTDISSIGAVVPGGAKNENLPWYLELDYGDEMIYDRQGQPRGGTMRALVEQLTHHNQRMTEFNNAMLLTFRSFSDAHELFSLLSDRFYLQPPEGLTAEEFTSWKDRKQIPVRLRVVNILKSWLEYYWLEDDVEEAGSSRDSVSSGSTTHNRNALLDNMLKFATNLKVQKFKSADALISLIEQRIASKEPSFQRRLKPNLEPKPTPIVPKNMKKAKVTDIDPREMARQLTLRDFALFKIITPQECLNRGCGSRKSANGPNRIGDLIHNSNNLTNWVSMVILKSADPKKRAATVRYFIDVAKSCRDLNNFSSMTAINASLHSSTIHRMKKTWELVPQKAVSLLESLNKLMNSSRNFNEYREVLSKMTTTSSPCVPFFGVYLTDLTFTEDGNPDYLNKEKKIINFAKRAKLASTIESIRVFQRMPYNFEDIREIQDVLKQGFESAPSIEDQYDMSVTMEPRTKAHGPDKVSLLLQENGIL